MSNSWLPTKNSLFVVFVSNFSTLLTATPGKYGLVAGDAAIVAAAFTSYNTAYTTATNPGTRTSVTIATAQTAKNALCAVIRSYGRIIRANDGVADADKQALGLIVPSYQPSPVPAPGTMPILGVVGGTPMELTLTYRDQNSTPRSRAKPAGVSSLELRASTSSTVISDPTSLEFASNVTRTPFVLPFTADQRGKTAYIAGRWVNRKGQRGPWSAIIGAVVS